MMPWHYSPKYSIKCKVINFGINSIHGLPAQGPYSAGKLRGQNEGRTNTLTALYKLQTVFKIMCHINYKSLFASLFWRSCLNSLHFLFLAPLSLGLSQKWFETRLKQLQCFDVYSLDDTQKVRNVHSQCSWLKCEKVCMYAILCVVFRSLQ